MRLLHTADWHLGKTLKGQNLLDDQNFILNQLFDIISDQKIDAMIISGDIYDRAVPPADAVELFSETLTKLAEKKLPTLIIAGNHDSATRLNFGSKIFEQNGIFIAAKDLETPENIILEDEFGEIYFTMIPYFDFGDIQTKLSSARQKIPLGKRNIAIAHVFLTGGIESEESERKFVGGAANIDSKVFNGFNYVALGHLHRPQSISNRIRYAGSPMKYSFDEANHKKSVTIAEFDAKNLIGIEKIALIPRRDVIIVEGTFNELNNRPTCNDYAQIILSDDAYIYETEDLRDAFPHFLEVRRKSHLKSYDDEPARKFRKEDPVSEQFANFFEEVTSFPLNNDEKSAFKEFLLEIEREEREVIN